MEKRFFVVGALILAFAGAAVATNYSLWINGRNNPNAQVGNYADFAYWGSASVPAGVNKISVNWGGSSRVADENYRVRDALDCYCTGSNWCYVAVHSAGNLQIGYALAMEGGSPRKKKTGVITNGVCGTPTSGGTQIGWNIKWVAVAAGAAGGSEASDWFGWTQGDPLVKDLKVTSARALYNHNETRSKLFYMFTGAKGSASELILPGDDDGAVAYHSSGGTTGTVGRPLCNPLNSGERCATMNMGKLKNEDGSSKWTNHLVRYRDDTEKYAHRTFGNWEDVANETRKFMVLYAK